VFQVFLALCYSLGQFFTTTTVLVPKKEAEKRNSWRMHWSAKEDACSHCQHISKESEFYWI